MTTATPTVGENSPTGPGGGGHPAAADAVGPSRPRIRTVGALWLSGCLAVVHLALDLVLSAPFLVVAGLFLAGVASLPMLLVGLPLLALSLLLAMGLAVVERLRLQAFTGVRIEPRPAPRRAGPGWRRMLLDDRPWRAVAYLAVIGLWGPVAGGAVLVLASVSLALAALPLYRDALPGGVLALPWGSVDAGWWPWLCALGLAGVHVLPLAARGLVALDIGMARHLLGRSPDEEVRELSERVQTLTETREAAVDSVEAERRRIERDLHDGPQQRLVAIAMDLGMARERLDRDPAGARALLDKAHESAKEAITEMRHVARGITPPVLTDRGLDAALSALAARSPVPVAVQVDLAKRPEPTIEAIAYFCVSEALTNVAKHSAATSARVDVTEREGFVLITVTDDGKGGADPSRGTGLHGLRDRVRAVDGCLDVSSPTGGPTRLTVRLPTSRRRCTRSGGTS